MKNIKVILTVLLMSITLCLRAQDSKTETIVVSAKMNCDNCVRKIEKSIPFEKGVRDLDIDFENQQVTVKYDPRKTDKEKILKAFEKIKVESCEAEPSSK